MHLGAKLQGVALGICVEMLERECHSGSHPMFLHLFWGAFSKILFIPHSIKGK